jgi:hypothetical protein
MHCTIGYDTSMLVVGDGWFCFDDDATDVTEVDHGNINIDAGICVSSYRNHAVCSLAI